MKQRKATVFVLMPFSKGEFDDLYEKAIKIACESVGAKCSRLDKEIIPERITDELYNKIDRADILVADVTRGNPNVYYEIGFAHGLGKNVILIKNRNDPESFPFDTKDFQHVLYESADGLKDDLERRIDKYSHNPEANNWNSDFHKARIKRFVPEQYEGFTAASNPIEKIIEPLLSMNSPINIKMMGVALHRSWPLIESLLEDNYLGKWGENLLTLEIAYLRKEWVEKRRNVIKSDWENRIKRFENSLSEFEKKAKKDINLVTYKYDHMPYLHGILINDSILFQSTCSWDRQKNFTVGNNLYIQYGSDNLIGDRKIDQFLRWFDLCKRENKCYTPSNSTTIS